MRFAGACAIHFDCHFNDDDQCHADIYAIGARQVAILVKAIFAEAAFGDAMTRQSSRATPSGSWCSLLMSEYALHFVKVMTPPA